MADKPLLVAIDTSTRFAGLALFDGETVLSESYWRSHRNQSVELMPQLVRMLEQQRIGEQEICAVAVALGPGSFTGLRIGVSVGKGLALARDVPILGVPTLDAIAFQHAEQRRHTIWAAIHAGRGRLCVARYERRRARWRQHGQIHLTTLDGFVALISQRCLVTGELSQRESEYIADHADQDVKFTIPSQSMRRPSCIAELAWRRFTRGESDDLATLSPIYIHPELS
jgi:tRNA threonylcarbamoyladenosine biosynthesis protein TsaB